MQNPKALCQGMVKRKMYFCDDNVSLEVSSHMCEQCPWQVLMYVMRQHKVDFYVPKIIKHF